MVKFVNKEKLKRIGIIGGTFDPVHIGHLIIAEKVREEFFLERTLFIPAGIPPHKKEVFASPIHRLEMVKIAIKDNKYFQVDDIEIKKQKPAYTYDTIISMRSIYPKTELFFITGADMFYEIETWHRYRELVKEVIFLIAPRKVNEKKLFPKIPSLRYEFIHSPLMDISSSYIRSCLAERKSVKYLLPDGVLKYIRRYKLYEIGRDKEKNKRGR
ncbi:MAG: nicotinate-nucleotide adenylyltransferase [Candidatus Ratteibacteria bacterium]|nr:nicotinate-nucleotide adenylyltransferase [Candidatus Ratteibacteria bacterium]